MSVELDEVAGLPLALHGFSLAYAALERGVLSVVYTDDDGAGSVEIVLDSAGSRCRGELALESFEHRTRAADLLAEVCARTEARIAAAAAQGAGAFPEALAWRPDLPRSVRFTPEGIVALLPELLEGSIDGVGLLDAYVGPDLPEQRAVSLEIGAEDEAERVVLTLRRGDDSRRVIARTAHFSVTETVLGASVSGTTRAASSLIVLLLTLRDRPALELEAPLESPAPASPAHEPAARLLAACEDAAFQRESSLLAPMLRAAESYFGAPLSIGRVPDAPLDAFSIGFEQVARPELFLAAPHALRRRKRLRGYIEALGFRISGDGRIRTVPTPESFHRLRAAYGIRGCGFKPWLYALDGRRESPALLLDLYAEGTIGIGLPPTELYRKYAALLRLHRPDRIWSEHLTSVARAMSVQVLATHRVPHAALTRIAARASDVAREAQRAEREDALLPLLELYQSDLVRHCQALWQTLADPDDFADAFEQPSQRRRFDAIVERRIQAAERACRNAPPPLALRAARAVVRLFD